MGSYAKLSRRALETENPVMVQVSRREGGADRGAGGKKGFPPRNDEGWPPIIGFLCLRCRFRSSSVGARTRSPWRRLLNLLPPARPISSDAMFLPESFDSCYREGPIPGADIQGLSPPDAGRRLLAAPRGGSGEGQANGMGSRDQPLWRRRGPP